METVTISLETYNKYFEMEQANNANKTAEIIPMFGKIRYLKDSELLDELKEISNSINDKIQEYNKVISLDESEINMCKRRIRSFNTMTVREFKKWKKQNK